MSVVFCLAVDEHERILALRIPGPSHSTNFKSSAGAKNTDQTDVVGCFSMLLAALHVPHLDTALLDSSAQEADADIKDISNNAEKQKSKRPEPEPVRKKPRRNEPVGSPVRPRKLSFEDAVEFSDEARMERT